MKEYEAIQLVENFIAWSEYTYHEQLKKKSVSRTFFSLLGNLVSTLPDYAFVYDRNLGKLHLARPSDQVNRSIILARETHETDALKSLSLSDVRSELPNNMSIIDLDQFPYSKELAEGLILVGAEYNARKDAMTAHFKSLVPFEVPDDWIENEVKLHIANPGGGISYIENPNNKNEVVCFMTYSSKEVDRAGRVQDVQSGVDKDLIEWKPSAPNTASNLLLFQRLAVTKTLDNKIASLTDLIPELGYLLYAGFQRYSMAKACETGSHSFLINHFASLALEDFLNGSPFCHGAESMYLKDNRNAAGMAGARDAIDAQMILRERVNFRLTKSGFDDRKIPDELLHSAIFANLRATQPQKEDRTPGGFSAGRIKYVTKDEATQRLKALRDLYFEGALNEFPQAASLARNVIASALLLCPSVLLSDLTIHPSARHTNAPRKDR